MDPLKPANSRQFSASRPCTVVEGRAILLRIVRRIEKTMTLSKKSYRGTRDFFPEEQNFRQQLFAVMHKTAQSFAYTPYDGPLLEEVALYEAKSGQELINDQIYSFTDRGERHVAIRPEMTPTLARMVAQVHREVARPLRWYSIPNLMRYEKPQKGRLREHWQFNCDIFGAPELLASLEILQVVTSLLQNYGATEAHFEIFVNDRRLIDQFFQEAVGVTQDKALALYKVLDRAKKIPLDKLAIEIEEIVVEKKKAQIVLDFLKIKNFSELDRFLSSHLKNDRLDLLQDLIEKAKVLGIDQFISYDSSIVRGLDYYTGIVFEVFDKNPENKRALCGGGAYSELLKIFDEPPLLGVGLGLGDVTLVDFLTTHGLLKNFAPLSHDLTVCFEEEAMPDEVLKLSSDLRGQGLSVLCSLEKTKFKKACHFAEKKGAHFLAFWGPKSREHNEISLRNLKTREESKFSLNDIQKILEFIKC